MWQVPAALVVWLSFIQWPQPPTADLDPSWQLLLSDGWRHGRQHGTELIYTFGPWGFLFQQYLLPDVVSLKVAFELGSKVLIAVFSVALAADLGPIRRFLFLLVVICLGPLIPDPLWVFFMLAITNRYLLAADVAPGRVGAAIAVLAFLSLVKFTNLIFASLGIALAAGVSSAAGHHRRSAAIVVGYGLSLGGFWLAAGQALTNLPSFSAYGFELSGGYPGAMSLEEDRTMFALGAATLATLVFAIGWWVWPRRRSAESGAVAILFLAGVYLSWKHGFTRADAHVAIFFFFALFLGAAMPAVVGGATAKWPMALLIVVAGSGVWRVWPGIVWLGPTWANARIVETLQKLPDVTPWRTQLAAQSAELVAAWQYPRTAAVVGGQTVDLIDFEQGIVLLNGFNYRPRPVPQSYVAYTPALLRLNRAFIESDRAPAFLMIRALAIDGRLLAQNDSLLLAELPRRYEPVLEERDYLLLRRRAVQPAPGSLALTPIALADLKLGEAIELPDERSHALWLQARARLAPLGQLRSLLYKPPVLTLTAENETQRGTLRIIPGIVEAGFVLQPFLADANDLSAFLHGRGVRRARRIRFDALAGQERYWSGFEVRVSRIEALPVSWQ